MAGSPGSRSPSSTGISPVSRASSSSARAPEPRGAAPRAPRYTPPTSEPLPVRRQLPIVLDAAPVLPFEDVSMDESAGRYLQEEVRADHDYPDFDKSRMDGFAVVAADLREARRPIRIVQEVPAGMDPAALKRVTPGMASRIMTGAPIPP